MSDLSPMSDAEVTQTLEMARNAIKLIESVPPGERFTFQREGLVIATLALHLAEKAEKEKRAAHRYSIRLAEAVGSPYLDEMSIMATIGRIKTAREQAEARLAKAREDLRKYGKHTKPCILAGLVAGDHGQYAECTCGLDATLKGEPRNE